MIPIAIVTLLLEAVAAFNSTEDKYFGGGNQRLECYSQLNGFGQSINTANPINDLYDYGWDNKISSCCFTGFWFLYEDSNYNRYYPTGMVYYGYGNSHCRNMNDGYPSFNNKATSLRYVGAPDGYKYDTVTLFEREKFAGYDQYSYGDKYSFGYGYFGRSAAITGCSAWTLYQYEGYKGDCVCLYPKSQTSCEVGLYPDLGYFNDRISSARKGCHCGYSKYPSLP